MTIAILKPGLLTTVQDLGRTGFRRFGINPNGAMAPETVRLLNILLGNEENEAVLEIHFPGPVLEFKENALIAIGGADFGPLINNQRVENGRPVFVEKSHRLRFSKKKFGNRAYLAVRGGFEIEKWLGSASTNLRAAIGGFRGRALRSGDEVFGKAKVKGQKVKFDHFISPDLLGNIVNQDQRIRIIAGPELDFLTGWSQETLVKSEFTIRPDSDRMGYRLEGEPLYLLDELELVSSAVSFGTIQLLPNGQLIILMADHQTTGGYPRIAQVITRDLSKLAQLGPQDPVSFEFVSIEEAEKLLENFENEVNLLKLGCKFRRPF